MVLVIELISNKGVNTDTALLDTLDADAIPHFKKVMRYKDSTKANTYSVELSNLSKNMQPNTSEFINCFTTIEY